MCSLHQKEERNSRFPPPPQDYKSGEAAGLDGGSREEGGGEQARFAFQSSRRWVSGSPEDIGFFQPQNAR